jgi:hypothetical protein
VRYVVAVRREPTAPIPHGWRFVVNETEDVEIVNDAGGRLVIEASDQAVEELKRQHNAWMRIEKVVSRGPAGRS